MGFPVACAKVANEGTLEMSRSRLGSDTSVEKNLEAESHKEVLAKAQVLEETQVATEMQVSAETQILEEVLDGESTREVDPPRDAEDIVAFCIHAIGIPEKELTRERLQQVGCEQSKLTQYLLIWKASGCWNR